MDHLRSYHPNSLSSSYVVTSIVIMPVGWVWVPLTCHGTSAKYFCDSLGLKQSVTFLTWISNNGTPSLLDLILSNFPENVCCSSSAPIGSSHHVLVKVNISLAVIREPPQRRPVWHFTQADWQGLQAAIKLLDWSPISVMVSMSGQAKLDL